MPVQNGVTAAVSKVAMAVRVVLDADGTATRESLTDSAKVGFASVANIPVINVLKAEVAGPLSESAGSRRLQFMQEMAHVISYEALIPSSADPVVIVTKLNRVATPESAEFKEFQEAFLTTIGVHAVRQVILSSEARVFNDEVVVVSSDRADVKEAPNDTDRIMWFVAMAIVTIVAICCICCLAYVCKGKSGKKRGLESSFCSVSCDTKILDVETGIPSVVLLGTSTNGKAWAKAVKIQPATSQPRLTDDVDVASVAIDGNAYDLEAGSRSVVMFGCLSTDGKHWTKLAKNQTYTPQSLQLAPALGDSEAGAHSAGLLGCLSAHIGGKADPSQDTTCTPHLCIGYESNVRFTSVSRLAETGARSVGLLGCVTPKLVKKIADGPDIGTQSVGLIGCISTGLKQAANPLKSQARGNDIGTRSAGLLGSLSTGLKKFAKPMRSSAYTAQSDVVDPDLTVLSNVHEGENVHLPAEFNRAVHYW
jgi:hypothetical protein